MEGSMEQKDDGNLDNTLIESLFYNEMMLMEESPSLLVSILSADGTPAVDASTLVESALLGEFGVNSRSSKPDNSALVRKSKPNPTQAKESVKEQPQKPEATYKPPTQATAPVAQSRPTVQCVPPVPCPLPTSTVSLRPARRHIGNDETAKLPLGKTAEAQEEQPQLKSQEPPATDLVDDSDKREKMISQFATLASRLGIQLPPQVLSSTEDLGAASTVPIRTPTAADNIDLPPDVVASTPALSSEAALKPIVKELEATAEEAIAAVSKKRSFDENATISHAATGKQPIYSKRRKKASLSECERRLASLQAENNLLKRHVHNVANKSAALQSEQKAAEAQIRTLWESNASQRDMDAAVSNLTELYSDYGKRRRDELSFHLEQLQRLANPTNVTKMGLWALGQQSIMKGNPIAGMLQKELGITAQQGRKILEQREKIRHVSSNLKECLDLLAQLQKLCDKKTGIFHDRLSKCREILTPRQVVKLILWIDEHSEVLGKVCPGWGSEYLPS